jgi:hypothetical protein
MSRQRQKNKQQWVDAHVGQITRCSRCPRLQPAEEFWDSKHRKVMKTCRECLAKSRYRAATKDKCARPNYKVYINSAAWKAKKEEYWASGRLRKCYLCGASTGEQTDMHHRTYERLGREDLDDLVPLCAKPCHASVTKEWNKEKRKKRCLRRTLWQVTEDLKPI